MSCHLFKDHTAVFGVSSLLIDDGSFWLITDDDLTYDLSSFQDLINIMW